MEKFIAAIDQGTTSTRCILFDHSGKIISLSQQEHRQIYPQPGWVEHDALEIWQSTKEVIQSVVTKASLVPGQIAGMGITNQRETTVLWDKKTGKPFTNAIVWQDTRTDAICSQLAKNGGQDRFRKSTGLPLACYFSGPKIKWLLENTPGIQEALKENRVLFGNMDTWLIWNLTGGIQGGVHVTDVSNASRTQLMNIHTLDWDEEILADLGILKNILPKICSSSEVYGYTQFLWGDIPVCGDLGDQQAALFGQTCFSPGQAKNTYGTGCFLLMNTGTTPIESHSGLLTTLGYRLGSSPAVYCLEGSVAIAGALVQWMRDNLGLIQKSSEIEELARSVSDNGDVYFVPAFSGLFAPYWRSDARGVIAGLTRFANRGHLARAVLEATAYQTREILEAMEQDSGVKLSSLKVDGGMVGNELLMQFQSDLLGVPVIRPTVAETTALGAAYAAGLACGYWKSLDECADNWASLKEWRPGVDRSLGDELFLKWKKAVNKSFGWVDS